MTPAYTPEQEARIEIDRQLEAAGWQVQDYQRMNLHAQRGVAVREFPLKTGFADYLLCVDGKAIGAVEAKKTGTTLSGVHHQSQKYSLGLPDLPPAWRKPLPFLYESTGLETYFTSGLFFDPTPRTRELWVYDFRTNQNFTLKQNPLSREHLDEFVACFKPENRHQRTPTWSEENPDGRWRAFSYEDLVARDKVNLDIFWLRDESLEDTANLPDPDVLALEIVEDLQAALEQFSEIAEDLGE
jgi:hypothetical protein